MPQLLGNSIQQSYQVTLGKFVHMLGSSLVGLGPKISKYATGLVFNNGSAWRQPDYSLARVVTGWMLSLLGCRQQFQVTKCACWIGKSDGAQSD